MRNQFIKTTLPFYGNLKKKCITSFDQLNFLSPFDFLLVENDSSFNNDYPKHLAIFPMSFTKHCTFSPTYHKCILQVPHCIQCLFPTLASISQMDNQSGIKIDRRDSRFYPSPSPSPELRENDYLHSSANCFETHLTDHALSPLPFILDRYLASDDHNFVSL